MYFERLKWSEIGSNNNVVCESFAAPRHNYLRFSEGHELVMKFIISKVSSMLINFYNMQLSVFY